MKNRDILLAASIVFLLLCAESFANSPAIGIIQPISQERMGILVGDKATANVGWKEGVIKGDIGTVSLDRGPETDHVVGRCAVTKTTEQTSVCEVISASREIERGHFISFDRVAYADATLYPYIIETLASVVEPYEPYEDLKVCFYGIFDNQNAATELSEDLGREFRRVFSQKRRIQLVGKDAIKNLVVYPNAPSDLIDFVKNQMEKNEVDALLIGNYELVNNKVLITIKKLDRSGHDRVISFWLPPDEKYASMSSKTVVTAQEMSKVESIPCKLVIKSVPYLLRKDEKAQLIDHESRGDILVAQSLRRIDFNMVRATDVRVKVDGETFPSVTKDGQLIKLSTGLHSVAVSFRRGYLFNETLLYTSEQELTKQAVLDLTKEAGLVIEVGINPLLETDAAIGLNVYHPLQRQRQVLKPIYRVETEKNIETFKD